MEALWSEFRIPMWVTEFDWNGDGEEVDFGDYTEYASILEDFYTLMLFRQEVTQSIFLSYLNLYHQRWRSSGGRIQFQLHLCPCNLNR